MSKTDRLFIRVNKELKESFKRVCQARGETISENITSYMKNVAGYKKEEK